MKKTTKLLMLMFLVIGLPFSASAYMVTYDLSVEFSGATPPEGPAPWLRATFNDNGANKVTLTMAAIGLVDAEFVRYWYFNVYPYQEFTVGPPSLGAGSDITVSEINFGEDGLKADGDGNFDFRFVFANSGDGRFQSGESISFVLSGVGLDARDFLSLSVGGGNSPYGLYTAAHVQGIGQDDKSGWITTPVPEPISMLLFGTGLVGVGGYVRRKFKK